MSLLIIIDGGGGGGGAAVTWNPADKAPEVTLSNGNLTANGGTTGAYNSVRATSGKSSGKHYFEVRLDTTSASNFNMIGIVPGVESMTIGFHLSSFGFGYYEQTGQKWNNNIGATYGASYTAGDVIGVAFDASAGTLEFFKNGTSQGVAFTSIPAQTYYPVVSLFASDTSPPVVTGRFKAADFTYTPPTGYAAWGA